MSADAVTGVLDRAMHDEAFLDRVLADPAGALEGYDLDEAEEAALVAGDERAVRDHLDDIALATAVAVIVITLP